MKSILNDTNHFFGLTIKSQTRIVLILICLVRAALIVRLLPLRIYYKTFFSIDKTSRQKLDSHLVRDEIYFFRKVILKLPWSITCLIESIAFSLFMRQYKYNFPIFIGVRTENGLQAHAWYLEDDHLNYKALNTI